MRVCTLAQDEHRVICVLRKHSHPRMFHPPLLLFPHTVPPETHSDLIPWARKIEFESCE